MVPFFWCARKGCTGIDWRRLLQGKVGSRLKEIGDTEGFQSEMAEIRRVGVEIVEWFLGVRG